MAERPLRISLKGFATLSEFFDFLKKQSLYPGVSPGGLWEDDIDWIQVIPPERMVDSDRRFLDRAEHLRTKLRGSKGGDPSLFFFTATHPSRLFPERTLRK